MGRGGGGSMRGSGTMPARTGARFESLRRRAEALRPLVSAYRGTAQGAAYRNELARINQQQQRIMDRFGR